MDMLPTEIAGIAVAQLGLFSTAQCRQHGLDKHDIAWLLRGGDATSYRRSVLKATGTPELPEQPVLAACLAGGDEALAATWTACGAWDLPRCGLATGPYVTAPKRLRLNRVLYVPVPDVDLQPTIRRNVPVPSAAMTVALMDGVADRDLIQQMVDHGVRFGLFTVTELEAAIDEVENASQRPLVHVRAAAARVVPNQEKCDTELEVVTLREIEESGVIRPQLQFQLVLPERLIIMDAGWPSYRIAVEAKHSMLYRQAGKWESDDEKANLYAKYRWTVFTRTELTPPGLLGERLRAVLPLRSDP
jgi:hypothetical protein